MYKLAAIVGPTAAGKTELAIGMALKLGGEIISCDSMQVYRGMDIGTAKASCEQRHQVPHHLIDIVDPDGIFTVADYQRLAQAAIKDINRRGKVPILVGGTGLYYQAVVDNYSFYPMETQALVRKKWDQLCSQRGLAYLYAKLQEVDPQYAIKIGSNDRKRIIRALEVYELTGRPFSESQGRDSQLYRLASIGLYLDRAELYQRIDQRVDKMIAEGLVQEVEALRSAGYDLSLNSMQALGYKQIYYYLEGWTTRAEMVREIKRETRRYAKRQYTWFNKDKRIQWLDVMQYQENAQLLTKICEMVEGQWAAV